MNDIIRIWVDPNFHKKLKRKAVDEGITITELTKIMSKSDESFNIPKLHRLKKKKRDIFEIIY